MLTDGIGLGLEYGLRYSGLVDRGTARAVHHGFNDLGMLVGGSSIAKTIIKKASRGFKLRATPSGLGTQPQPRYLDDHIDLTTQNRGVSSPTGATNRNTQSIGLLYLKQRREAVNRNLLRMQRTGTGTAEAIPDSMVASSSNGVISAQRVTSSSSVSSRTSMAKPGNVNGVDLDKSRVRPINNRKPINSEYANSVYPLDKLPEELRRKYPHSVPFTGTGHPDFSRYAIKKVKIQMTGKDWIDFPAADKMAGFDKKPSGFTWHHHHDGETMLLVPFELHDAVKHTGGRAIIKDRGNKQ